MSFRFVIRDTLPIPTIPSQHNADTNSTRYCHAMIPMPVKPFDSTVPVLLAHTVMNNQMNALTLQLTANALNFDLSSPMPNCPQSSRIPKLAQCPFPTSYASVPIRQDVLSPSQRP